MASSRPPSLNEAVQSSKESWQRDLQALFSNARDRFPDVVWELAGENEHSSGEFEEVWGHKAIVYARAPPSFQARYFSFRPAPAPSPIPYHYTQDGQSAVSLNGEWMAASPVRSLSPIGTLRTQSPSPSVNAVQGQILRLTTTIASSLFSNELEYLYTGKGFGEAFEFLFETTEEHLDGVNEDQRVDKLRKDLVFMWRSRLYSDVRLVITGTFSSSTLADGEASSAQFSSHRFMLVSRSPYFRDELLGSFARKTLDTGEPLTLNLPSPPFTPASLHFILGYIYTGTVAFSNRTFDLDTSFHILRCAIYLSLTSLHNEVQARIVQEMMHGLFHAFLDFSEYENVTEGRWGVGGCKCRTCARRAPRILEFAQAEDVKNQYLERGARRALVGLYGEGWCNQEFTALPLKTREGLIRGVGKRAVSKNILPMVIAANQALIKLDRTQGGHDEIWSGVSRDAILSGLKIVAEALCDRSAEFFEELQWLTILESDGIRFEDVEQVEWIMDALKKGLAERNAAIVYQVLVSSILIRPHPSQNGSTLLSAQSRIRVHVEKAREDVIRWLRRKWIGVREVSGFNGLDGWALKEISHEIEVPVEDLLVQPSVNGLAKPSAVRNTLRVKGQLDDDASSTSSLHVSPLTNGNIKSGTQSVRERAASYAASIRSVSTTTTITSRKSTSTLQRKTPGSSKGARPETLSQNSSASSPLVKAKVTPSPTTSIKARGVDRASSTKHDDSQRIIAISSPNSTLSRNPSSATSKSEATFKSAKSEQSTSSLTIPRPRRSSGVSVASAKSSSQSTFQSKPLRGRRDSVASIASTSSKAKRETSRPTPSPIPSRPKSVSSVRSAKSTASTRTTKPKVADTPLPPLPSKEEKKVPIQQPSAANRHTTTPLAELKHKRSVIPSESDDGSTVKGDTMSRRASNATITASKLIASISPRGAVLNVGIPCIISSKRARFRAYARYIGEMEGETGPWVGVEVPVNESWGSDKLEGRQWSDGSWGGVRYFEIHSGNEWDESEDKAARRRRFENISTMLQSDPKGLKREGEQLVMEKAKRLRSVSPSVSDMSITDTRALFVRPQQVLYVVDAVGSDI